MIVVTTPTGNISQHVVRHLLSAGKTLRLIVRDPAKLPHTVRDQTDVVVGSHGDEQVVDRAFVDAQALFWVAPPVPAATLDATYSDFTRPAADAIRRNGIGHVVVVSALGRDTPWHDKAGLVTASIRMTDLLGETGAAVRGLAMPGFMENTLRQRAALQQGQLFGPIDPAKKLPYTATRDMGAAAARLLLDRSWAGQADIPVLGPEDLSCDEMASILSDVLGRAIRYQQVPFDAFKAQLMQRGMSDEFAQGYVDMMRAKNEGMDNVAARTPETTGPTSFRQWAEEELKPVTA